MVAALPPELKEPAAALPVTYDPRRDHDPHDPDWDDTLGLFVGRSLLETDGGGDEAPPQIILFLANLWAFADHDETVYREEVRTTFLHELGHFLGLEEIDLEERGL